MVLESTLSAGSEPELIAARYFPAAEIVVLEGGKNLVLPKIWVCSDSDEPELTYPGIFMRYDWRLRQGEDGVFGAGCERLMAWRLEQLVRGAGYRSASVYVDGRQLKMKDFVADFVRGGVLGMLSSLKGAEDLECDVELFLKKKPGRETGE